MTLFSERSLRNPYSVAKNAYVKPSDVKSEFILREHTELFINWGFFFMTFFLTIFQMYGFRGRKYLTPESRFEFLVGIRVSNGILHKT